MSAFSSLYPYANFTLTGSVLCKKQDLSGITASIGGGTITQIRGE
jgi:hypothetical protein